MPERNTTIDIGTGTILRVAAFVFLLWLLYLVRNILAIIMLSIVIASAVDPAVNWFMRRRIPRLISVILTYVIAFIVIGGAFSLIVPPLFGEIASLTSDIPQFLKNTAHQNFIAEIFPSLPVTLAQALQFFVSSLSEFAAGFSGDFLQVVSNLFGGLLSVMIVIVLSFYLSAQERGIETFLRIITPIHYEEYVLSVWERTRRKIGKWLQGQILLGLIVGVMVFLGLSILQVRFVLSLAVLAAIFELIPFGATLAAIPAVLIAFLQEPVLGALTLLLYVVIQQVENNLIYPIVMRKAIGVHPALVLVSLIVGGQLGGLIGLLLAVPVAVLLVEISNDIAAEKNIT